ncbi:MAG: hypothetical protein AAB353_02240 [Candidatus Hydrogenedentota bacterium]
MVAFVQKLRRRGRIVAFAEGDRLVRLRYGLLTFAVAALLVAVPLPLSLYLHAKYECRLDPETVGRIRDGQRYQEIALLVHREGTLIYRGEADLSGIEAVGGLAGKLAAASPPWLEVYVWEDRGAKLVATFANERLIQSRYTGR